MKDLYIKFCNKLFMPVGLVYLMLGAMLLLQSCTTVEQVRDAQGLYCSGIYKGMRAVGRSALSITTGVVVSDVCDRIDDIVKAEASEESDGGSNSNNSSN